MRFYNFIIFITATYYAQYFSLPASFAYNISGTTEPFSSYIEHFALLADTPLYDASMTFPAQRANWVRYALFRALSLFRFIMLSTRTYSAQQHRPSYFELLYFADVISMMRVFAIFIYSRFAAGLHYTYFLNSFIFKFYFSAGAFRHSKYSFRSLIFLMMLFSRMRELISDFWHTLLFRRYILIILFSFHFRRYHISRMRIFALRFRHWHCQLGHNFTHTLALHA